MFLHPASKYPGPKLASVSYLWYAYHWYVLISPTAMHAAYDLVQDHWKMAIQDG